MTLIDTSSWIHFLRTNGDPAVRARVQAVFERGEACSCAIVRLELWVGARGPREAEAIRAIETDVPDLPIDSATWRMADELARRARAAGITPGAADALIAATARLHQASLEHADSDFNLLRDV